MHTEEAYLTDVQTLLDLVLLPLQVHTTRGTKATDDSPALICHARPVHITACVPRWREERRRP